MRLAQFLHCAGSDRLFAQALYTYTTETAANRVVLPHPVPTLESRHQTRKQRIGSKGRKCVIRGTPDARHTPMLCEWVVSANHLK